MFQLSELPKIWKTLCFSSTIGVDNVAFQSYQNPVFRTTKILTTVRVDTPLDRSFQSYQNPDNFKSWPVHSWVGGETKVCFAGSKSMDLNDFLIHSNALNTRLSPNLVTQPLGDRFRKYINKWQLHYFTDYKWYYKKSLEQSGSKSISSSIICDIWSAIYEAPPIGKYLPEQLSLSKKLLKCYLDVHSTHPDKLAI